MKFDFESIKTWAMENRAAVLIVVLTIVLIVVFGYLFDACGRWRASREHEKNLENINALMENANEQRNEIQNLKNEALEKQVEVNVRANEYENAKEATNNARVETNRALDNVNAVNGRNFNGTSYPNANAARCKAFPNAPECGGIPPP